MMTKKEIEEKYWINFTFDEDIEFIPRLYDKKNKNEVDESKILHIKPFLMKDYTKFMYSVKSLQYEKNNIPDKNIIKMSYLDYIFYLIEKDMNKEFDENDDRYNIMYRFFYIISKSLGFDIDTVIPSKDEKGKNILLLNFKQRFIKTDRFNKDALFVVNNPITNNQISLDYVNENNKKYGYEEIEEFDYVINEPIQEDIIVLTSKDIDFLKQIICYQNIVNFDDEWIDPRLKKDMETTRRLKNMGCGEVVFKKRIFDVMMNFHYKTIEEIMNIPIITFFQMSYFIEERDMYMVKTQGMMSGMVSFDNPISSYLCDNYNKFDNLVDENKVKANAGKNK